MAIIFSNKEHDFDNDHIIVVYYDSSTNTYTRITDLAIFDYFKDDAKAGDALFFGWENSSKQIPTRLIFYIGTTLSATSIDIRWKYCNYTAWNQMGYTWHVDPIADFVELPIVADGTNNFQNTGERIVEWELPNDFSAGAITDIDDQFRMWIKAEIASVSGLTEGGSQSTQNIKYSHRTIDIEGSYDAGTVTGLGGTFNGRPSIIKDSSKAWANYDLTERYVLFVDGACKGEMYPIKRNGSNWLEIGEPRNWSGDVLYTQNIPAVGDPYVISYVLKDVYDASIAEGLNWIKAYGGNAHRHFLYNVYEVGADLYIHGHSETDVAFLSTHSEIIIFTHTYGLQCYNYYRPRSFLASGWSPQDETTRANSKEMATGGSTFIFNGISFINPIYVGLRGWLKGCHFIGGIAGSWTKGIGISNSVFIGNHMERLQHYMNNDVYNQGSYSNRNILCRKSEPLRNPDPHSIIKNYMTDKHIVYATGSSQSRISNGYVVSRNTFTSWAFTGTCEMIDMHPETNFDPNNYAFYWYTKSGTIYGGILYREYHVKFSVLDPIGFPVEGAKVNLLDNNGKIVFSHTTDSNGEVEEQLVTTHTYTWDPTKGSTNYYATKVVDYNPFTLDVIAPGYKEYVWTGQIHDKTQKSIALIPITADPEEDIKYQLVNEQINSTIEPAHKIQVYLNDETILAMIHDAAVDTINAVIDRDTINSNIQEIGVHVLINDKQFLSYDIDEDLIKINITEGNKYA